MTNSTQTLLNTIDTLKDSGVTPKITVLKTRGPRKGESWVNGVKGGSTRVRCNGGSRATSKSGGNSALNDVR
jgi:hypothetical protein